MLTYPHRISYLYGEGRFDLLRPPTAQRKGKYRRKRFDAAWKDQTVWPSENTCTAVTAGRKIQKLVVSSPDGKTMKRASGKRLLQPSQGLISNEKSRSGKISGLHHRKKMLHSSNNNSFPSVKMRAKNEILRQPVAEANWHRTKTLLAILSL